MRKSVVVLSVLALAGSVMVSTSDFSVAAPAAPSPDDKITAGVRAAFDSGEKADFWVRLADRADTASAAAATDRTERGKRVVDTLRATADRSQEPVRRLLDADGVGYTSYWVTNAVLVRGATKDQAKEIAGLTGVAGLHAPRSYPLVVPVESTASGAAAQGVEWGLTNINAPGAWAQGARGEGIVVANVDTGVQYDHPALVRQYRGNNGDGTFTHDYNWFDPSRTCGVGPVAPCDNQGHGTHTMGTIAGDDGAGNQIGVAPSVRWIAAKGCEDRGCTDASLLAASQWILAPTDLNGSNPDVSRRPHIVNNSWGNSPPSTDPYLEDIQQAWADSGIFGVWANGNDGATGCRTSGSPGSRTLNYSVGMYDVNNVIDYRSGKGPGQDGEIKPNIAAPGVNVRSSVPGNGYGFGTGTSMATPHVTGSVALLWSKWSTVVRDIAGTRTLLDVSARDHSDLTCGGTAADNNVYGEGRLDVDALVRLGSTGIGRVSGRVTDARTGQPVGNATVTADGQNDRSTRTGADGAYTLSLIGGDYQVTVGGVFGYRDHTATVTITHGTTTAHDVALAETDRVAVTGVVRDGGGHGWPLHAKVSVSDGAGHDHTAFTDPVTGRYAIPVVGGVTYTLVVTAVPAGYEEVRRQVVVGDGEVIVDVALPLSPSCVAPGYRARDTGRVETFDSRWAPPWRWSVSNVDLRLPGYDNRPGWVFDNPGRRPNNTGGKGNFAIVDSDHYGQHHVQDTTLAGPTVDMSGFAAPFLEFGSDLNAAVNSNAVVDLSLDGGRTWTMVWQSAGFTGQRGAGLRTVPIPQAAGKRDVRVRFHYTGQWSGWWKLDNVFLGNRLCEMVTAPG